LLALGEQGGLHDGLASDDGQQSAAGLELVQQGLGHGGDRAGQHDGVEGGLCGQAMAAIGLHHLGIVDLGTAQVLAGQVDQLGIVLQGDHTLGLVGDQSGHIAAASANLQHAVVLGEVELLHEAGFQLGREHLVAARQRDLDVHEGQAAVGGGHELFTANDRQQGQHGRVQHVPGADLLFDHVEAGLFDVHGGVLGVNLQWLVPNTVFYEVLMPHWAEMGGGRVFSERLRPVTHAEKRSM